MSCEILYDKQFIKTTTGFIPFVLMGSNNVTQFINGRERRARAWNCINSVSINLSETELTKYFKGWCGKEYQEHFKHKGNWVDDKGLMNFVKNGIKNARSIEEIRKFEHGFSLSCQVSVYEKGGYQNKPELYEYITGTPELEAWIDKAKARFKNKADNEDVCISIHYFGREPLKLGRIISMNCEVMALYKNKSYVCDYAENRISYSPDKSKAIVFNNSEHLKSELNRWLKGIRIIKAGPNFNKAANFVIKASNGNYKNVFVQRKTRIYLHFCYNEDSAKKFPTFKQAEKYINDKLRGFRNCEFSIANITEIQSA